MKKQKFVELIKSPEKMSTNDFVELEQLLKDSPYFQNGHTVLAKASKILKSKTANQKIKRAAIYATNRDIFKNYLTSQTGTQATKTKPSQSAVIKRTHAKPQDTKAPNLLSKGEQEKLISEIYENLDKWKSSRDQYLEYEKEHPEEIVILPIDKSTDSNPVQDLKNQILEEVEAEEKIDIQPSQIESPQQDQESPEVIKTTTSSDSIPTEELPPSRI